MEKQTKPKKEKETNLDKQLKRTVKKYLPFVIWLAVLAVIFIVLYFAFQGLGKVKYQGLVFTKEKYGDIPVYHYSYLTAISPDKLRTVEVLLRGNPAENKVPISGEISYPRGKIVYIGINSTVHECNYSTVGISPLTIFLANNGFNVKVGTLDKSEALKTNLTYVTCKEYPASAVISIRTGDETKIEKSGDLCYDIYISNCEIVPAIEKFIVQSMLDAKDNSN